MRATLNSRTDRVSLEAHSINAQARDDDATSVAPSMTSGEGDTERTNRLAMVSNQLKPINQKLADTAYFL